MDSSSENIVYAVFQGNGAWGSLDGGATWTLISPGFEGWCVAVDKLRPGFVYGLGGWTYPQRSGCYGGTGWKAMSASWSTGWFARGITVDPNDSSKIYACSNSNPGGLFQWVADVAAPIPPSNLTATASGSGITLGWNTSSSSDCTGYWVYRTTTSGSYPLVPYAEVSAGGSTTYTDINASAGSPYYYKVAAIDNAQNHSTLSNEAGATVSATYDLDVTYIERQPHDNYRYNVQYTSDGIPYLQPGTESQKRWPAYGETVTFVAHFINKGTATTPSANYRWKINGAQVATGTAAGIGHYQEGTATLNWTWNVSGIDTDASDQTVTFEINYDNAFTETYTQNNSLTDYIEGLSLFVVLEPALYDALNAQVNLVGTYSAEDWLQQQMKAVNSNFSRSTYPPRAATGSRERMRIDGILVASSMPTDDLTCDGRWMISGGASYANTFALSVDGGLCHEWMHQIGLIDDYNMNLESDSNLVVTPDGLLNGTDFTWARPGLMGGGDISPHTSGSSRTMPEYLAQFDVGGLNSNCGYRRGYYGEFMFDIAASNYIQIKDTAGNPAPNVTIRIFQRNNGPVPNSPVITGVTDSTGRFLLPNRTVAQNITTATGHTEQNNPFGTINVVGGNATCW